MMNINFKDKTVFITGGSRGIGKKIKEIFLALEAKVISPDRNELNLSDLNSLNSYLDNYELSKFDIFIHCAGINKLAGIDEITLDILQEVFTVNYYAPTMLLKNFTSYMKNNKYGRIVFISSLYSMITREKRIAYSSSKNALTGLMKTTALELAPYGILVNSVAPGYVMTDMTKNNLSDEEKIIIESNIPTGKFQTEEDIANLCIFLCSDLNNSITGQLIAVDGGFLLR